MIRLAIVFALLTTFLAGAAETTNVTAVIEGRQVEFSSHVSAQIVERSIDLLASCGYRNDKAKWGAPAEPESMTDAQKKSHLRLVFSTPRKVELPFYKTTLQAREMVITLPLSTAGIWVRTNDGVTYFSKFQWPVAEKLKKLLDEAQNP